MKNIGCTLLLIALLANTANAQFGFEMGLNMADLSIKSPDATMPTKFKPGAAFGILSDISMNDEHHVYFEPGLFYESAGCIIPGTPPGKFIINTLTIPLNIEYKTGEKCSSRFFIGGGPYIGDNVSGSYYFNTPFEGIPYTSETVKIGTDFRSLDLGLGANIGYQLKKHLYARVHYQVGIVDFNLAGDAKIKPSAFGLTLGYLCGRCSDSRSSHVFVRTKNDHWRGLRKGHYSTRTRNPRYPK